MVQVEDYAEVLRTNPIFKTVKDASIQLEVDTYVIGGYVRDLLLGRPNKDIDFVCVGSGIALAEEVAKRLGGMHVTIFKNFGTAMIKHNGFDIEFVGARKESYDRGSRKPVVENGTLEEDQHRRDFTINALGISMNERDFGLLIDPFGGVDHMNARMIKTPLEPAKTFSDDPLRMMRAIRFASQLDFDIDPDTFQAIIDHGDRLKIVSMERIVDELNKIILSPVPSLGFKLLFHSGLLKHFFSEMVALQGVEYVGGNAHKDNFYHTLQVLDNVSTMSYDLWLRWAAVLHDIAKPLTKRYDEAVGWTFHGHEDRGARMVPALFRRLKLPMNEKMLFVQKLVRLHLRPIALVNQVTDSAIRRLLFEAGDDIDALMMLCRADITSKNTGKVTRFLNNFDLVEARMKKVEEKDKIRNFQPPVSGEEIMQTFGIGAGRIVGQIKDGIKDAIIEGTIRNDRQEALELMMKMAKEKGLIKTEINSH